MGKRRTQQQVRKIKPKNAIPAAPPPADSGAQRKQREKYVASGGLLQGYAPEFVIRLGYYALGVAVACLLIGLLLLLFLPYGLPVRIVAALVWLVPIAFGASFLGPGYRLATKDRKLEPKLVQGQLLGASAVSTSLGLGMLMVKTRGGNDQYLVQPEKLAKVPGNQVQVMITVTPNLRHVRSLGIMGQRLVGRPEQPVPEVIRRLRLLPLVTPAALAGAAVIGDDGVALIPIHNDILHAILALLAGVILGGAVYGVSFLLQRRMYAQVQTLMPGAV